MASSSLSNALIRATCTGPSRRRRDLPYTIRALPASGKHARGVRSSASISSESLATAEEVGDKRRADELKEAVRRELESSSRPKHAVKYVDTLQQLGIGYHFRDTVEGLLDRFCDSAAITGDNAEDLSDVALRFRVTRQNGYNTPQDVFKRFLTKDGGFHESLVKDSRGLLDLYEASSLGTEDEDILAQAMEYSRKHLQSSMPSLDPHFAEKVRHALQAPRHTRMERYVARHLLEQGSSSSMVASPLFELARLDFNTVQALYQSELSEIMRWWRELGLARKLSFARDRPMECFFWSIGIFPDPSLSLCRVELAKTVAILLVIDDIYDSYGSLDELILFTDAIKRWDVAAIEELPEYMRICYMSLFNTANDISYKILKEHGYYIGSYLKKTWTDLCEAFLTEARWFNDGFVPSLKDYLSNGITTAGTYMALVHAFFFLGSRVSEESLRFVTGCPKLFFSAGKILRLWDDLGTAEEEQLRGDVASSMECLMQEKGCLREQDARKHIRHLISCTWKDLNQESMAPSPLPAAVARASLNLARTAQSVYQHGDDEKTQSVDSLVQMLLIKPINQPAEEQLKWK